MVRICQVRGTHGGRRRNRGFTLLEVIVALFVLSVATYVIMKLFSYAVDLGQQDRSRRAAYSLAQACLADISMQPTQYQWPSAEALAEGKLAEVPLKGGDPEGGQLKSAPPNALPAYKEAADRETRFFERFTPRVFARIPDPSSPTCEVTVVVNWVQGGKDRSICLTTLMRRTLWEGQA